MQDRYTFSQDKLEPCFQKPAMRRALGELTNSPRRALGELTNSPRRALGELTNSPRLLEQHSPRFLSPGRAHATPTKEQTHGLAKKSPAITPTHNLKLLTELAAKVAGGSSSSARQTLQFEDVDTSRYSTEPVCLGGSVAGNNLPHEATKSLGVPLSSGDLVSPHKDHSYPNKNLLAADFEPKDEICSDYIKLEPTVTAEEARIETGLKPLNKQNTAAPHKATRDQDMPAPLPPLPASEAVLFAAPNHGGPAATNRKDKSLGLLAERMLQNYPYAMGHGDCAEVQLDDTAKLLHTERRRIYDIVNVFEAVQMMSRVCKNVYRWHGRTYLVNSLAWLRQLGIKLGMQEQYRVAREQEQLQDIENLSPLTSPRLAHATASPATGLSPMMSPYSSPAAAGLSPYGSPNDPSGTSMGINTQKFLMLFLVIPEPRKLTLDFAAKVIHGPNPNEKAKVTRVRRLYDIANILQALGLIRKVQIAEGKAKKPAFEYIGPNVEHMELSDEDKKRMPSARQKNSLLAVGKNLAHLPDKDETGASGSGFNGLAVGGASMLMQQAMAASGIPHYNNFHAAGSNSSLIGSNQQGQQPPITIGLGGSGAFKRARSLSSSHSDDEQIQHQHKRALHHHNAAQLPQTAKIARTHSEPRSVGSGQELASSSSLLELGQVCQRERERIVGGENTAGGVDREVENLGITTADGSCVASSSSGATTASTSSGQENQQLNQSVHMKPPTPRCPSVKMQHKERKRELMLECSADRRLKGQKAKEESKRFADMSGEQPSVDDLFVGLSTSDLVRTEYILPHVFYTDYNVNVLQEVRKDDILPGRVLPSVCDDTDYVSSSSFSDTESDYSDSSISDDEETCSAASSSHFQNRRPKNGIKMNLSSKSKGGQGKKPARTYTTL